MRSSHQQTTHYTNRHRSSRHGVGSANVVEHVAYGLSDLAVSYTRTTLTDAGERHDIASGGHASGHEVQALISEIEAYLGLGIGHPSRFEIVRGYVR